MKQKRIFILCAMSLGILAPLFAGDIGLRGELNGIGAEFSLHVYLQNVYDIHGLAFDLVYTTTSLQLKDRDGNLGNGAQPVIQEWGVLTEGNKATVLMEGALEMERAGRLVMGATRTGSLAGVDIAGQNSILSVAMILLKNPPTAPVLQNIYAEDHWGNPIELNILPTELYNLPPMSLWLLR